MGEIRLRRSGKKSISPEINLRKGTAIKKKDSKICCPFFIFHNNYSPFRRIFCMIIRAYKDKPAL